MEQSSNDAAAMDAQIKSSKKEYVGDTEQSPNDAAVKDAQTKQSREECARGTEHTATPTMNLQLLHHTLGQNLTKLL